MYPKSIADPDVDSLLAALGHMPFAVTLMAKLGKKSRSLAKELHGEWSEVGTEMLSHSSSPENNMNRSISLSVDRDFVQQNTDALLLLSTLCLLPAGTSRANLCWWAPGLKSVSSAIATLSDVALLLIDNQGSAPESIILSVLPVVRSFMFATNRIPDSVRQQVKDACCQYVFAHGYRYYDPEFKKHSEALAAEDTNIQSILPTLGSDDSPISPERLVEVHLRFTWYRRDTSPSVVDVAQHTLDLAKSSGSDRYIAEALCALGRVYYQVSKYELAEQMLLEAYQLFDKLADRRDIERLLSECVSFLTYSGIAQWRPLEPILSRLYKLQSETNGNFERALILKALGYCFCVDGRYSEAVESLQEAADIFIRIGQFSDGASSMLELARSYRDSSRFTEALKSIERACAAVEHIINPCLQALIDQCHGTILVKLDRNTEAFAKFETSLSLFLYLGNMAWAAQNMEYLGYLYMSRSDCHDAVGAYTAAVEKYIEMGQETPASTRGIMRCEKNLAKIRREEGNSEELILLDTVW